MNKIANKLLVSPSILWESTIDEIFKRNSQHFLPGPWQIFLLGDGSPTRHLHLLTGKEVSVQLIAMESELTSCSTAPKEIEKLKKPLLRRQVWLECGSITLAWAESWWNLVQAERHLQDKNQPIWKSLTKDRSELFRQVDGLNLVEANWLNKRFNNEGPYWSRYYRFFRNQQELTVIREVFNPKIEDWLGPTIKKPLVEK